MGPARKPGIYRPHWELRPGLDCLKETPGAVLADHRVTTGHVGIQLGVPWPEALSVQFFLSFLEHAELCGVGKVVAPRPP